MSVLVVWASPNSDGLTAQAKDHIVKGVEQAGRKAETVYLNRVNIKRCLACGNGWGLCRSEGNCIIKDDFQEIYEKLKTAEGIVWITPVYWHDMAESLKTFMDRLRRCETAHNHSLKAKKNIIVACAGGSGIGAVQCLHIMEETLNHMGMTTIDRLPIIQFNKNYMLPALTEAGVHFAEVL